jgi:hypothetical protein
VFLGRRGSGPGVQIVLSAAGVEVRHVTEEGIDRGVIPEVVSEILHGGGEER